MNKNVQGNGRSLTRGTRPIPAFTWKAEGNHEKCLEIQYPFHFCLGTSGYEEVLRTQTRNPIRAVLETR